MIANISVITSRLFENYSKIVPKLALPALIALSALAVQGQCIEFVGSYGPLICCQDVCYSGGYTYLTDSSFYIINVADPNNPVFIGSCEAARGDIEILENYAFVAEGGCDEEHPEGYLRIIDITDPEHPTQITTYDLWDCPSGLATDGNYMYFSEYCPYTLNGRLEVVNITDPFAPQFEASIYIQGFPTCAYLYSGLVFVGEFHGEPEIGRVHIYDVHEQSNPQWVGLCELQGRPQGIYAIDNRLYVAEAFSPVEIYDFSDPANPQLVGSFDVSDFAREIRVQNDFVFVVDEAIGLQIFDISNPANPVFMEAFETPGYAADIFLADNYIYIADSYSLIILRFIPSETGSPNPIFSAFSLSPNYPNPFNSSTTISYDLPQPGKVTLDIYDILGRKVETLYNCKQPAGSHSVIWNADGFSSGVYFYKLTAGKYKHTQKMMLLK